MKLNNKLEMKFIRKAKYHIHFNFYSVNWSDNNGPPSSSFCQNIAILAKTHF